MSKLAANSHFLSPVSCDSLVLQGLRCEWGAGVLNLVLSLSLSHTGHWKFNMAPHGKELFEDLKKRIVALHKDSVGYKKIANTLKLVAKTIQWARPYSGLTRQVPLRIGLALALEGVGGQPVSAQTIHRTLHQIGLHGCRPRRKPLLKMLHKKAR